MSTRRPAPPLLLLALGLWLGGLAGCDGASEGATGPIACGHGGLTCDADEACVGTGQGACGGPAPGPEGCGPDCQAYSCGGGVHCLCSSFQCEDLDGCRTCACLVARPGNSSCLCEEVDGRFTLDCPGA